MSEHARRVLESIRAGCDQKSKMAKATCLSPNSVAEALRELRRAKAVAERDGRYVIVGS